MTKPREFWIDPDGQIYHMAHNKLMGIHIPKMAIHVIEKSAYDELAEMYAVLLKHSTKLDGKLAIAKEALKQSCGCQLPYPGDEYDYIECAACETLAKLEEK